MKNFISLALALTMALTLAVPAFAVDGFNGGNNSTEATYTKATYALNGDPTYPAEADWIVTVPTSVTVALKGTTPTTADVTVYGCCNKDVVVSLSSSSVTMKQDGATASTTATASLTTTKLTANVTEKKTVTGKLSAIFVTDPLVKGTYKGTVTFTAKEG